MWITLLTSFMFFVLKTSVFVFIAAKTNGSDVGLSSLSLWEAVLSFKSPSLIWEASVNSFSAAWGFESSENDSATMSTYPKLTLLNFSKTYSKICLPSDHFKIKQLGFWAKISTTIYTRQKLGSWNKISALTRSWRLFLNEIHATNFKK